MVRIRPNLLSWVCYLYVRTYIGKANSLMESEHFEEAIQLFSKHAGILLTKLDLYKGDKKKSDAINSDLNLISSLLRELRQKSLSKFSKTFSPINTKPDALQEELGSYSNEARGAIKRMVTYKLPDLAFQDVIGHQVRC